MSNLTNESFLAELERDYPNQDWDHLEPLEAAPDVFTIHAKVIHNGREYACCVREGYATMEEAERQVQRMRETWKDLVPDSPIEVRTNKPDNLIWLHEYKTLRARVLAGEKVFPMHLP